MCVFVHAHACGGGCLCAVAVTAPNGEGMTKQLFHLSANTSMTAMSRERFCGYRVTNYTIHYDKCGLCDRNHDYILIFSLHLYQKMQCLKMFIICYKTHFQIQ
jgi:hypothetical protein